MKRTKKNLDNLRKQFISVNELLDLLVNIDCVNKQTIARWLVSFNVLNKTKSLILENDYILLEYDELQSTLYRHPIHEIKNVADGDMELDGDTVGFARKRLLIEIRNQGIDIPQKIIDDSIFYVSSKSYEYDDNFYKKQCIDLMEEKGVQAQPLDKDSRYARLFNPNDHLYSSRLHALAEIHVCLNMMDGYDGKNYNKDKRIRDWLEDNDRYGLSHKTEFHVKALSALTVTIADQKTGTEIIKNLNKKANS